MTQEMKMTNQIAQNTAEIVEVAQATETQATETQATETQATETQATETVTSTVETTAVAVETKAEAQVVETKEQRALAEVSKMLREVFVDGRRVYVVINGGNIEAFKTKVVEAFTTRPNRRRTVDGRFDWIMKNYLRDTYNLQGKHITVTLHAGRDAKGHFVKLDLERLKAEVDAVKVTNKAPTKVEEEEAVETAVETEATEVIEAKAEEVTKTEEVGGDEAAAVNG
jgi:hypothetical protein